MRFICLPLFLAAALLLGCTPEDFSPTSLAEPAGYAKDNPVERPFKAKGVFNLLPPSGQPCPPGSFRVNFSVAGTATHLGQYTGQASQCNRFLTNVAEGTVQLQAANGDGLTLDYFSIPAGPADGGLFRFEGEYTAVDGTGRFAGAGGSGVLISIQDFVSGNGTQTVDGTIVY